MRMAYTIEQHQHRFAAWAAGRAASVNRCRFSVRTAKSVLEEAGFRPEFSSPRSLPRPAEVDGKHQEWRQAVIEAARRQGVKLTHGVAAKLINVYLKARFVSGGWHLNPRVKCLHPPIDALLLDKLATEDAWGRRRDWRRFAGRRWSKFTSGQYEELIALVRQCLGRRPLWKIEEYWAGHW
jgi:hypothetical protein